MIFVLNQNYRKWSNFDPNPSFLLNHLISTGNPVILWRFSHNLLSGYEFETDKSINSYLPYIVGVAVGTTIYLTVNFITMNWKVLPNIENWAPSSDFRMILTGSTRVNQSCDNRELRIHSNEKLKNFLTPTSLFKRLNAIFPHINKLFCPRKAPF